MQLPALLTKAATASVHQPSAQPTPPFPLSFTRTNDPNMLTAHQVEGNHSTAWMLPASGSTAWDTSQGILVPGPGPAQQETHFHHCGGCTSGFPLLPSWKPELKAAVWHRGSCLTTGIRRAFSLNRPPVYKVKPFSTKSLSFCQIWLKWAQFKCFWGKRRQIHTALTLKFRLRYVLWSMIMSGMSIPNQMNRRAINPNILHSCYDNISKIGYRIKNGN